MSERGESVPVGDAIGEWLLQSGVLDQSVRSALERAWREAAGETVADATRVVGFRREELLVEVSSAPLRAELEGFRKPELVEKLRELYGRKYVSGIRFLVPGSFG
jgi:hypothetical protein